MKLQERNRLAHLFSLNLVRLEFDQPNPNPILALQVKNARLSGEKPETAEENDAEREKQSILQQEHDELQSLHQSKDSDLQLSQEKEVLQ